MAMLVVPAAAVLAGAAPASAGVAKPVITFSSPAATLNTSTAQVAFTYNRTPKQTQSVSCALAGPTPSPAPCTAPTAAGGGSSSGVSYSNLANGSYTFTVTVTLTDGGTVTATRGFTVAAPTCIPGNENFSEDTFYTQPAAFSGGTLSGYKGGGVEPPLPQVGFTDNYLWTGQDPVTDFTVTFTNPVKSLSLSYAEGQGSGQIITITAYDAANNVVYSTSNAAVYATPLSISSTTANIAYVKFTADSAVGTGVAFTDMNWGC
jgi:hypothetical protein